MLASFWLTLLLILGGLFGLLLLFCGLTWKRWAGILLGIARWRIGYRRRTVMIDGILWAYHEVRPQVKDTLILLHGFGSSSDIWLRFAPLLDKNWRLIIPDLPGCGKSTYRADRSYTLAQHLQWLQAFCNALRLKQFHLVGGSLGGYFATSFAATYPHRVRSLALFDPAGVEPEQPTPLWQAIRSGDSRRHPLLIDNSEALERMLRWMFYRKPWVPFFLRDHLLMHYITRRAQHLRISQDLLEQGEHQTVDTYAEKIAAPTLIVWGDNDRLFDLSTARQWCKLLPHARFAVLSACGHLPMMEKPQATARIYRQFCLEHGLMESKDIA